jgi:hypothetical protein
MGELIEEAEGALWRRADLEKLRERVEGPFDRVVVAVDPPASSGPNADACGIIAAAARGEGFARELVLLADSTVQGAAPSRAMMFSMARTLLRLRPTENGRSFRRLAANWLSPVCMSCATFCAASKVRRTPCVIRTQSGRAS